MGRWARSICHFNDLFTGKPDAFLADDCAEGAETEFTAEYDEHDETKLLSARLQFASRTATPKAISDYCENREVWSIELVYGYGARMSAPGYMDRTDWSVFGTVEEAEEYLEEYYGDEEDEEENSEDEADETTVD
jgi:hypothetical protein